MGVKRLVNKTTVPIVQTEHSDGSGKAVFDYETERTVDVFSVMGGAIIGDGITRFLGGYMSVGSHGSVEEKFIYHYELDKNHNAIIDEVTGLRKIKKTYKNDRDGNPSIAVTKFFELHLPRGKSLTLRIPEDKVLVEDLLNSDICANRVKTVEGRVLLPSSSMFFINDETFYAVVAEKEQSNRTQAFTHYNDKLPKDLFSLAATCMVLGLDVDKSQLNTINESAYKIDLGMSIQTFLHAGGYVDYLEKVVANPVAFSKECFMKLALELHVLSRNEDGLYITNVLKSSKGIAFGSSPETFWEKLAQYPDVERAISEKINFKLRKVGSATISETEDLKEKKQKDLVRK
jgi:hypothetical protein